MRRIAVAAVVLALAGAGCGDGDTSAGASGDDEPETVLTRSVTYRVDESSAPWGSVTYSTADGTEQVADIGFREFGDDRSWGLTVEMEAGSTAVLTVQNGTEADGVTCIIEVDGVEVASNTSEGAFVVATCTARV